MLPLSHSTTSALVGINAHQDRACTACGGRNTRQHGCILASCSEAELALRPPYGLRIPSRAPAGHWGLLDWLPWSPPTPFLPNPPKEPAPRTQGGPPEQLGCANSGALHTGGSQHPSLPPVAPCRDHGALRARLAELGQPHARHSSSAHSAALPPPQGPGGRGPRSNGWRGAGPGGPPLPAPP